MTSSPPVPQSSSESEEEPAPPTPPPAKKKKSKKKKATEEPAPEPEPEPEPESSKSKKKSKKKKGEGEVQKVAPLASTAPAQTATAAKKETATAAKKEKKAKKSESYQLEDDGWEVVPSSFIAPKKQVVAAVPGAPTPTITLEVGEYKREIIGKAGATINQISSSSGAKIDMDKSSSKCVITGDAAAVADAAAQIKAIMGQRDSYLASQTSVNIDVPEKKIGAVVGKGGATIKAIEAQSGARVKIDKESNAVTLSGTSEQVAVAAGLVENAVNPPEEQFEASTTFDLSMTALGKRGLAKRAVMIVKGRGGSVIREIEKSTGARLEIERDSFMLVIKGAQTAVVQALSHVSQVLAENSFEDTITLSDSKLIGVILGKGGCNIRKLEEDTNARVSIDGVTVTVSGSKEQTAKAKAAVEALLADPASMKPQVGAGEVQREVELPPTTVGSIIGKGGATVKSIQESTGAKIDMNRGETAVCYVTGTAAKVEAAVKIINEKIAEANKLSAEREARAAAQAKQREADISEFAEVAPAGNTSESWGDSKPDGDWGGSAAGW